MDSKTLVWNVCPRCGLQFVGPGPLCGTCPEEMAYEMPPNVIYTHEEDEDDYYDLNEDDEWYDENDPDYDPEWDNDEDESENEDDPAYDENIDQMIATLDVYQMIALNARIVEMIHQKVKRMVIPSNDLGDIPF